ncbi:hypothetical protein GCM10008937_20110 [Deinococcus depolymerans]|uniref:Transcriptional regulator LacI/GalR-like sensor domain-containing protein n=1 Tax=Deinococcus depolymerans TaxID=392408 RepID=A0ABN1C671_9DEIO
MGFDDLPGSQFTLPPLTSVHHPAREMGELAARHLLTRLNDPDAPAGLPGLDITLSVRESVRAARP